MSFLPAFSQAGYSVTHAAPVGVPNDKCMIEQKLPRSTQKVIDLSTRLFPNDNYYDNFREKLNCFASTYKPKLLQDSRISLDSVESLSKGVEEQPIEKGSKLKKKKVSAHKDISGKKHEHQAEAQNNSKAILSDRELAQEEEIQAILKQYQDIRENKVHYQIKWLDKFFVKEFSREFLDNKMKFLPAMLDTVPSYCSNIGELVQFAYGTLLSLTQDPSQDNIEKAQNFLSDLNTFYRSIDPEYDHVDYSDADDPSDYFYLKLSRDFQYLTKSLEKNSGMETDLLKSIRNPEFKYPFYVFYDLQAKIREQLALHSEKANLRNEVTQIMESEPQFKDMDLERVMEMLKLQWLHGTKLSVLEDAMRLSDGFLKPLGELLKDDQIALTGEQLIGANEVFGINMKALSGVSLDSADRAIFYSKSFNNYSLKDVRSRLESSAISIDKEASLGRFFECDVNWISDVNQDKMNEFYRLIRETKQLKRLDPEQFQKKDYFIKKIYSLASKAERCVRKTLHEKKKEIFEVVDSQERFHFYQIVSATQSLRNTLKSEQGKSLQKRPDEEHDKKRQIPLVFASSKISGIPQGSFLGVSKKPEEVYPASLQIGEELDFLFTTEEHLPLLKKVVQDKGLEGKVHIESLETLELISDIKIRLWNKYRSLYSSIK